MISSFKTRKTSYRLFICFLIIFSNINSQTIIISPSSDGGFENGSTFASNGWTATTGSATRNQWVCDIGATAGFSGSRCAYVSNNTNGNPPPHTYTTSTTRISHIYRNISIPNGETDINLSFSWICQGEGSFDKMTIWLVPTSYTPTYGTSITSTGTAPTGRVSVGNTNYSYQSTWTTSNVTIPSSYAGTNFRLVFEWSNDDSLGTNPPIGIDNISLLSAAIVAPTNDNCSTASSLIVNSGTTCSINTSGTTFGATQSQTGCNGTADDDVWYSFTATSTSQTITVTPNTLSDAVFQVFSNNCGSLVSLSCVDNTAGSSIETTTLSNLSIGTNYYIRVYSYSSTSGQGTFSICITTPPPPPINYQCSSAISLTCSTSNLSGTTLSTSNNAHGTSCSMSNYGVWYTFVGDGYQNTISATTTSYDIEMSISSGNCGSFSSITCQDSALSNGIESYTLNTTLGTNYYIYISHWDSSSSTTGNFTISRTCVPPPSNDSCTNAISLTVNPTTTCSVTNSGTTNSASQSQSGCTGNADDDVWYSFVATNTSHKITVSPNSLSNAVFEVFSGSCSSLNSLACTNNTSGTSTETTTINGLTIGNTYYIRVYSFANLSGQGTFSICVSTPCSFGSGNGTSNMACPNILAGGLGLNGADPSPINTCSSSTCTDLEATYLQLGQTTNYTVQSIPFSPPYQFGCLQNSVSISVDDIWSQSISLPFNFCFYGNNYNSCLIGSNGVISFDQTNNIPGGYSSWSFSNNLPSTNLFLNTIFGVYHDIDPSKGGEVGWELVTLQSGCRALVASWNDIPMFSSTCNSLLYTGMIVLYENTNIIEVYIKEKKVCPTWNSGNAVVGLQNANGTQAVVAPNRNSLDTDWTVNDEAWRFLPSGNSITTITWYEGNGTTGPIVGNTSTISVCPSQTTNYTAKVSYTFCNGTTLDISDTTTVTIGNSKIWNGSVDTDWDKSNNWTPVGIPNNSDCVIIPITSNNPIISGTNYNGLAGNLTVKNGATLTINSNNSISVTDWVNVETTGTFIINNNSSLIQINNSTNTGNITYKRNANLRRSDYVYWSSPVSNYVVNNIANPLSFGYIYKWNTTLNNPNGGQGNWENASGNIMIPGKGYIASGPSSFSTSVPTTLNGTFVGVPNNGIINFPITRGNDTNTAYHTGLNGIEITNFSDNWNLIGNPYPSAIRGSQFLFDNNSKIEGNIKLWTHGTLPAAVSNPFYDSFVYNYSPGDYLTYNFTGTSCCPSAGADLFIGSGQGFFVQMHDGSPSSDFVTFNNNLRSSSYANNTFYRLTNSTANNIINLERNRIWLDIISLNGNSDRTLFGYIQNATMERDSFFDCAIQYTGEIQIYSLIEDVKFTIQGRSLPFDINDEVPVGVNIPSSGNYSIAIGAVDGLFNYQNIYLKDILLNITHDIKTSPYLFTSQSGIINDRFKIVYQQNSLGINDLSINNNIKVITNHEVAVSSSNLQMDSIIVFNVLGQEINTYNNINNNYFTLNNLRKNNTTLLLKIKLTTGETVVKKVFY